MCGCIFVSRKFYTARISQDRRRKWNSRSFSSATPESRNLERLRPATSKRVAPKKASRSLGFFFPTDFLRYDIDSRHPVHLHGTQIYARLARSSKILHRSNKQRRKWNSLAFGLWLMEFSSLRFDLKEIDWEATFRFAKIFSDFPQEFPISILMHLLIRISAR